MTPSNGAFHRLFCFLAVVAIAQPAEIFDCRTSTQTAPAYSQSSDGFRSQIAAILQSYRAGDTAKGQQLIGQFHLPNAEDWFSEHLGPAHGAELRERYERLHANFAESFAQTVEAIVANRDAELVTDVEPGKGEKPNINPRGPGALSGMVSVKPPNLFFCHFKITVKKKDGVMWADTFVREDGAFRFLGFGAWPFWAWQNGMEGGAPKGGSFSTAPILLSRVGPVYPAAARERQVQGVVVLLLRIDKDGVVKSADVLEGNPLLTQAAIDAAKQWHYKPGTLGGAPAESETRATVTFSLH